MDHSYTHNTEYETPTHPYGFDFGNINYFAPSPIIFFIRLHHWPLLLFISAVFEIFFKREGVGYPENNQNNIN